jgi:murein DD-endopeptidase MepM/ murein hydrolase activator NlpD
MGKSESYTVMILPGPTAEPYRFSLSKKALYYVLAVTSILSLVLIAFLIQYLVLIGKVWELGVLRTETKAQEEQIKGFLTTISDLKKQMLHLQELESKLRVITDTGPPKERPQEIQENREAGLDLTGVGGPEEMGPAGSERSTPIDPENETSDAQDLFPVIQHELASLAAVAAQQRASFLELSNVMQGKRAVWASTPSIWPVNDGWLTSGFGNRLSPFRGEVTFHKGIDIAARPNTPIVAPANGRVIKAGFEGGFGNMIKIDHGFGMGSGYGHLAKVAVHVGQGVKRGQVIGYVGNTGLSTGPHLHYEVYVNNTPVNPLRYILNEREPRRTSFNGEEGRGYRRLSD